jgi:N-acetylmuramoyl-L-alanine amidase
MIAALALMLQAGATVVPVTVRAGDRATPVHVAAYDARRAVRADAVALALGGVVRLGAGEVHSIVIGQTELDLVPGLPYARIDTVIVPLSEPPWLQGGVLLIPLQVLTELVPRFAKGFAYVPSARELRVLPVGGAASPGSPAAARTAVDVTRVDRPARTGFRRRTIVVDAGHGGPDEGMTGPLGRRGRRIYEKHIVLAVAKLVAQQLRAAGHSVVMTRTTDTLIALSDRGRIANRARGDLFISVHVNAAPMTWADPAAGRGFETYFLAEAKTEDARRVEEMENESVRFETGAYAPRGDPLSFIINDMAQNEHLRESNDLAETMQRELGKIHPGPNRGVKQANFAVLRHSFMPAVLVEIGFGTNREEAAFLSSTDGQRTIAASIATAAIDYMAHYEQRVGATR